jgi:hypothetical protein
MSAQLHLLQRLVEHVRASGGTVNVPLNDFSGLAAAMGGVRVTDVEAAVDEAVRAGRLNRFRQPHEYTVLQLPPLAGR